MQEIYSGYNNAMNSVTVNLNQLLANPYVTAMVSIFIILYAGMAAPKLPKMFAKLFDHTIFKVLILALILYVNNFNPTIAILVAIAFFVSLQTLSRHKVFDMAGEIFNIRKLLGQQAATTAPAAEEEEASYGANGDVSLPTGEPATGGINYGLNMETQVSGMAARTPYYMGPQGMKHPVGYGGDIEGADLMY